MNNSKRQLAIILIAVIVLGFTNLQAIVAMAAPVDITSKFTDPNFRAAVYEIVGHKISDWARPYVSYCQENGVMQGNSDGGFDPQGNLTCEQAMVVIERLISKYHWCDDTTSACCITKQPKTTARISDNKLITESPERSIITIRGYKTTFATWEDVPFDYSKANGAIIYELLVDTSDSIISISDLSPISDQKSYSVSYKRENMELGTYYFSMYTINNTNRVRGNTVAFSLTSTEPRPNPPTLSVNKTDFKVGEDAVFSWTTFPDAEEYTLSRLAQPFNRDGGAYFITHTISTQTLYKFTEPGVYSFIVEVRYNDIFHIESNNIVTVTVTAP